MKIHNPKCTRCKRRTPKLSMLLYVIHTKTNGKQQIRLCNHCALNLILTLASFDVIKPHQIYNYSKAIPLNGL